MDVVSQIDKGIAFQRAGDLSSAEKLYQQILIADPENVDAYHLLGLIRNSQGKNHEALNLLNIAISKRRNAIFLNTRGMIFISLNLLDEAQNDLRAAIKLDASYPEAFNNLAVAQQRKGNLVKALSNVRKAIELKENFAQGWITLGTVLFAQKDWVAAKEANMRALELDPNLLVAHINLSKIAYSTAQFEEASLGFIKLENEGIFIPDICFPHALMLIDAGKLSEASDLVRKCYESNDNFDSLSELIEQDAFFGVLHKVCSYLSDVLGDRGTALKLYEKSVEYVPRMSHVIWNNISKIYFDLNRVDEAIACGQKALDSQITSPVAKAMAYNNLGVFYMQKEDSNNAIKCFNDALKVLPGQVLALGWLLNQKAHICDWEGFAALRDQVDAIRFTDNTASISPFTPLAVYNDPLALKYWATLSAQEIFNATAKQSPAMVLPKSRKPGKFRVGYYSFDFRNHPVAHLTARVFELHNRSRFEIFAYSYGPDDGSEIRKRIERSADRFVDVRELSVLETAKRIAQDEIDFLIDLTGNTKGNRCQVLGLRPARKQAHWLGFIGTMGSPYYDYIIADSTVAPLNSQEGFAEQILHLESGFHIADDSRVVKKCVETRESLGLPEGGVIFGCFAQTFKIQPEMFDLWMRILNEVTDSVLWLANGPKGAEENLRKEMATRGIAPERLVIAQRCDRDQYLSRFELIDVHLDTFPYTSGTVASDALFSGCPLVTLSGETMVSKMAKSILIQAGLPELVADSPENYVEIAVRIARNPEEQKQIRHVLLQKRDNGKLLSAKKIVESLESAMETVLTSS